MYSIALLIAVTTGGEALDAKRCGGGCSTSSCYSSTSYSGRTSCGSSHSIASCAPSGYAPVSSPVTTCAASPAVVPYTAPVYSTPTYSSPAPACPVSGHRRVCDATAAPATIVVTIPSEATLLVDGKATSSTSGTRVLVSPDLEMGKGFSYVLTAQVVQDGKTLTLEEKVAVRAGETSQVTFKMPENAVASR